jgi:hypothetical protein
LQRRRRGRLLASAVVVIAVVAVAAGVFDGHRDRTGVVSDNGYPTSTTTVTVVLLYGDTPVYRSLYEGDSGPDVPKAEREPGRAWVRHPPGA